MPLPAILHWDQNHFLILIKVDQKGVKVADPAKGILTYTKKEFQLHWVSNHLEGNGDIGTALLLEPTPSFYAATGEEEQKLTWSRVTQYLRRSRWQLSQIFIALLIGSLLQLVLPFLTQSMVDTGINTRNMQYISMVLIAQLMLTFSSTVVGFIRSRLQLRISNSINISILSDFWIKLTRLPLAYFDSRHAGDVMQRIGDNRQIQDFFTGEAITTIFSVLNFLIYSVILIIYSIPLFLVFTLGNLLYFVWIRLFLRIRRKINYEVFHVAAKENNATLELIQGMQEIRLNNAEQRKRWNGKGFRPVYSNSISKA